MPKEPETPTPKTSWPHQPLSALAVVFVIGGTATWIMLSALAASITNFVGTTPDDTTSVQTSPKTVVVPIARLLDGLPLAAGQTQPYPVGVMIENLPEVRPQSGLSNASVVYETLAEGGATRFLALFSGPGDHLAKIGPVRSARPYYVEWNSEYDALYAHAGGSPDALQMISAFGVKDLNGIGHEAKYFFRDKSLAAPHNLFTSSDLLTRALDDRSLQSVQPTFASWQFKDDRPLADRPTGEPYVTIKFSGYAFETEYRYRQATNDYARFNSGLPHTDALTGEQIHAKNVIVQIIPKIVDVGEKGRLTLDVHGTGKALIFVDGGVNIGTWQKNDRTSRTEFFYSDGKPAELNRGSTWIAVVPEDETVEYGTR